MDTFCEHIKGCLAWAFVKGVCLLLLFCNGHLTWLFDVTVCHGCLKWAFVLGVVAVFHLLHKYGLMQSLQRSSPSHRPP